MEELERKTRRRRNKREWKLYEEENIEQVRKREGWRKNNKIIGIGKEGRMTPRKVKR